ncbi:YdeI/OmpD-associated family protein [Flavobacterium sp.]|uniref:YdeI/OmpD-associated family protein n=1 Tax=Flavobacterium sp. TaxID=239 RepID=UPI0039E28918
MEQPFFDDHCLLQKSAGKGGWTFITMPIMPDLPKKKNSTVRVRGFIDSYELKDVHIWAMKKGTFLAVKAEIRKAIKKEEGDTVKLILFLDEPQMVIPEDFLVCLREEPKIHKLFESYSAAQKKEITDWIFSAKTEDDKITRIAQTMEKLETEVGVR